MKAQLPKQILKQIIFNSKNAEEEIEFEEPVMLTKSQVREVFGRPKSIITANGDLWTEVLFYDSGVKIVIIYESQDNKIFRIHKIKMVRG
ncbi:ORF23 [Sulfolobus spindle-shaped virus 3]|nr:ORF23 [Sulfolobus spindle-shaped virus 3]